MVSLTIGVTVDWRAIAALNRFTVLLSVADLGEVERDGIRELLPSRDAVLQASGERLLRVHRAGFDGVGRTVGAEPVVHDEERLVVAAAVDLAVELRDQVVAARTASRSMSATTSPVASMS